MMKRTIFVASVWMVASLAFAVAYAQSDGRILVVKKYLNLGPDDLALQGYDPVEYLDNNRAVKGDSVYLAIHQGVTYYFASSRNQAAFKASPERYLPAYGGWCAFGLGMPDINGYSADKYPVDPESFKIVDGRLHLFFNDGNFNALEYWEKDAGAVAKRANAYWALEISGKNLQEKLARALHPSAPAEMAKIAFLLGEFECQGRFRRPDGTYSTGKSYWRGQYHFSGRAFMDDWWSPQTGSVGTTWRTFDTQKERWACIWLQAGTDKIVGWQNDYFYGNFNEDGDFVLSTEDTDGQGREYTGQATFTDITEHGFTWKMDISYDGGQTWTEDVRVIKATRIR